MMGSSSLFNISSHLVSASAITNAAIEPGTVNDSMALITALITLIASLITRFWPKSKDPADPKD